MKKPHVVAIIQARLGSTRLPGKTMMDLAGKTMLEHVLFRMKHSKMLDRVVVATTDSESDKVIIEAAGKMGVDWFAGSEEDVLDRFYQAAKKFGADVVVRLTADCPLNDPAVVDKAVKLFLESDADYVSNTVEHTYPNGVDVEVFSMQSLERAWNEGKLISEREHVTTHIWKHPEKFKIIQFTNDRDLSDYRWTVDEPQDAELIRKIFAELGSDKVFSMDEVIALFEREPELKKLNDGIRRNEGYSKCLREDRKVGGEKSEWKPTVVFRL
ncbi:TPA: acylneuraminate cytidylyltransferase, partial [Candidatus Micrarchaeota archaeon]|nr:acylneuraminate cytidylyltransferase [Candidatus Micrarchaeota archaeon]